MKNESKIIEREQKQLTKLEKLEKRKPYFGYFAVIMLLVAAVNIIDEITSSLPANLQSCYVTEFLAVNGRSYSDALALHGTVSIISYVLGIITPFYKALADKIGRKPMFFLSTLGMSVGMFIASIAPNYWVYLFGSAIMSFFIAHDIQIIYILEVAPAKHRARIYSILKSVGIVGVVAIPLMRKVLMHNDPSRWRVVYLAPAIAALTAAVCVLLFARETKVYIEGRTAYLRRPYAERKEESERLRREKKSDANKQGVFAGVKYLMKHPDLRALMIFHIIFDVGLACVGLYHESMLKDAGYSTAEATQALFFVPVLYAACVFLSGFVADILGRKKTILLFGALHIAAFCTFVYGLSHGFRPTVLGLLCGIYQGGYWIGRDYMDIMVTEKVPTEIRASVMGADGLIVTVGMAVGYLLCIAGIGIIGVAFSCLLVTVPCVAVAIIGVTVKVSETKGAVMEEITDTPDLTEEEG
ncbi:MAG: MFS transporter [Clostridia bacterium]|nr:MFS transporter [Clostridia bacterium]